VDGEVVAEGTFSFVLTSEPMDPVAQRTSD